MSNETVLYSDSKEKKDQEQKNQEKNAVRIQKKVSIRLKIAAMILVFTTIIIVSIGFLLLNEFNGRMKETMIKNAHKEIINLSVTSVRANQFGDDFLIGDNLSILENMQGFVYARVQNKSELKGDMITVNVRFHSSITEKKQAHLKKKFNQMINKSWDSYKDVISEKKDLKQIKPKMTTWDPQDSSGTIYYVFHYPAYRPFLSKNIPIIAMSQIVVSDEPIRKAFQKNIYLILIAALIFWAVGIIGSVLLSGVIVKPISILFEGAKIIGGGDLTHKIPDLGNDELGALAKQFNIMTDGLEKAQNAREERLIVDEQIRQAQEIQEGMNPRKFFKKSTYQIKGFTRAAKGVGGDYYDILRLPDGKMAVLISDVSGKSISASLVMVLIKTVVATYMKLHKYLRPDSILTTINGVMASQAHIDKFATILFFIYDPETREIEFSNGGHGPLFIYRSEQKQITLAKIEGLPMGIDEDNNYSISRIKLNENDMIILYTDGITEAWDKEKNEFGIKKLRQKILDYSDYDAKEMVERLVQDLDQFSEGAEQHDDMTLVVFKSV